MSFGQNLVALRKARGLSRKELAEKLEIPYTTLRNYEIDEREPGHGLLIKIATLFSVSIDELIGHKVDNKNAPPYSSEALNLAKDYDTLDTWGRKTVRAVTDTELERCADEDRLLNLAAVSESDTAPRVIPLYLSPAAAGIASPIMGSDYEDYELKPEDPQGAMFAVKVQGDSMAPHFPDGSIAFCNKDPLADGDVGVFSVDGGAVVKQYHKEGGIVYLFSLNRKRAEADVVLPSTSGRGFTCQGRVITKHRFPVPGR